MKRNRNIAMMLVALFAFSCNPYRKIIIDKSDKFYSKSRVSKNIDRYDVFIHDSDQHTYRLANAELNDSILSGTLAEIDTNLSEIFNLTEKEAKEEEKNDINIFINSPKKVSNESSAESRTVNIEDSEVKRVEMFAKTGFGVLGVLGTVLAVILGLIIALIVAIFFAISSNGGGSGSDSGGSNSGNGNSNSSGSSCYIATMAYGSVDAPEVITLRKFRDQHLRKWKLGRRFINWYYANSPSFVAKHKSKTWLHKIFKFMLNELVKLIRPFVR